MNNTYKAYGDDLLPLNTRSVMVLLHRSIA